jgi:hypothetical protein
MTSRTPRARRRPGAPDAAAPALDCFRYGMDRGIEHFVGPLADDGRIVATLRLEPVASAPLGMMRRVGAAALPSPDGAYATLASDPDALGVECLAMVTAAALSTRRGERNEAFWLAGMPDTLLAAAHAQGWRAVAPEQATASVTPMVLLLDDVVHLERIGSPLAEAVTALRPRAAVRDEMAMLFELDTAQTRRRARG